MNKTKPVIFICGGLMAIATLYGAIDLATSGELTEMYVEKIEEPKQEKIEKVEVAPAVVEKEIANEEKKVATKKITKKPKKKIIKEEIVIAKSDVEKETVIEEDEFRWEKFSRGAVNKRIRKEIVKVDSVKNESGAVTKN
jgi:hypothetical protein